MDKIRGQSGNKIKYSAINGMREDKKVNKRNFNYKKGREKKKELIFGLQTREHTG